ncbi:ESX secretion-associated protein EspG [Amycolatopsis sp. WQ 127309]|uniref:ESX secretion-associated protein EspG n=1 Tax=Amycolatopsis sp. WQ 127309 TaxID=2932773 RepID=UPI001FF14E33|nr:ESX secretion-associated protein EspG [Amycolatopsis sp. WQ 127309]UOZ08947.1 ESX secretion-associated protein EspG [Amycolatopsis sp. WQ 127309]
MLDRQVTLSTGTVINLIRRRGGEPHTVLAETPTWYSDEAQRAEDERVNAELTKAGLFGPRGMHPGFVATIEAVARPQLEYYGWVDGGFQGKAVSYRLLAGSAGGEAFVLAKHEQLDVVVLESTRPGEVLDDFLGQIPKLAPGRGTPIAVPKSQLEGGGRRDDDGFALMRNDRPADGSQEADELRRILALRRMGSGSLYVAARSRTGSWHRIERPVNYIDTSEGRWLTEEIPGRGESRIAFTPADQRVLADRLRSAQGRLTAA